MKIDIKQLHELSSTDATILFQERIAVFVVEQECPYQEIDDHDTHALHVRILENNELLAYSRIFEINDYVTFGRVFVKKQFRKKHLGKQLITETLNIITQHFPNKDIKISAQTYLQSFYESFGFISTSQPYLEDNISHVDMLLSKRTATK